MLNRMQLAIIRKDIHAITSNKRILSVLIVVPIVMTVVMPLSIILPILLSPPDSPDIEQFAMMLYSTGFVEATYNMPNDDLRKAILGLIINNILPLFFLMIPMTASSVMAASAFVGEKEKSTLETLLYCPLPLREIFGAKIMASFFVGFAVSALSFAVMSVVVQVVIAVATGSLVMPNINWLIIMLLVSPAVSLIAINMIVRGSAKAHSAEESQQRSVFLILPVILLAVGQFTGVLMMNVLIFLAMGLVLAVIALLMFKGSFGKFQYETLL